MVRLPPQAGSSPSKALPVASRRLDPFCPEHQQVLGICPFVSGQSHALCLGKKCRSKQISFEMLNITPVSAHFLSQGSLSLLPQCPLGRQTASFCWVAEPLPCGYLASTHTCLGQHTVQKTTRDPKAFHSLPTQCLPQELCHRIRSLSPHQAASFLNPRLTTALGSAIPRP